MSKKTAGVYFDEDVNDCVSARGDNRSYVINRDLGRLYSMYRRAILRIKFSMSGAMLICDSLNSSAYNAFTAQMLWAGIEDSIKLEGLAEKWAVDGPALIKKLQNLTEFEALAVIDAAECVWAANEKGDFEENVKKIFNI